MIIQLSQKMILLALCSCLLLSQTGLSVQVGDKIGSQPALDASCPLRAIDTGLDDALKQISGVFEIPMVVELAGRIPIVKMPAATITARAVLNAIVKRYPEYKWRLQGSVIHFYGEFIKAEQKNFLNWRLSSFTISGTVADVDLRLKSEINKVSYGITSQGGLVVGILPADLDKKHLPTITLKNVTAREVLFKLADVGGDFYTVVVFPRSRSLTPADIDAAFATWRWSSIGSRP